MAAKSKINPHRWPDGSYHSRSWGDHVSRVRAKRAGVNPDASLTGALDTGGAYGMAYGAAQAQFAPQINAAQQSRANVDPYFASYVSSVQDAQKRAQDYASPILQQANAWANANPTAAPGIDPNSQAAQQSQQAAASGQNLAQLGATTLAAIPVTANTYFSGLQSTAAGQVPVARRYFEQQKAQLEGQRNAQALANFQDIRSNEQNAEIARATLGLNQAKAAADTDLARGVDPVTGKPLPAEAPSASDQKTQAELDYFNEHGYWPPTGPPSEPKDKPDDGLTPAQKQAARERERKRVAGVRTDSGKKLARIADAQDAWDQFRQRPVAIVDPKSGKPAKDPKTGKFTRPPSVAEIREWMSKAGYTPGEVHVALLRRVGRSLDKAAIDYLHSIDVRIPREWLPFDPDLRAGSRKDPKPTSGQQNGIGGK